MIIRSILYLERHREYLYATCKRSNPSAGRAAVIDLGTLVLDDTRDMINHLRSQEDVPRSDGENLLQVLQDSEYSPVKIAFKLLSEENKLSQAIL
jgi:hypothetical protein